MPGLLVPFYFLVFIASCSRDCVASRTNRDEAVQNFRRWSCVQNNAGVRMAERAQRKSG